MMHAARVRRTGDPGPVGLVNGGDEVSYVATHLRLRKERGPASEYFCVDCEQSAQEWSYVGGAADERTEVIRGGYEVPYSLDFTKYAPRCVTHHRRFDKYVRIRA
jgi:hypothetical protein